ncbi:MAG: hypothetical protein L3K03_05625 [Thermoplasmata archaeon]|nr:hypothetical protein [Thermoplasmata archaeon]
MATATTTVRVSLKTLAELERLQTALKTRTLDETIRTLLASRCKDLIQQLYGSARGVSKFRDSDRVDSVR